MRAVTDHARQVRHARDLLTQVTQTLTAGGRSDASLDDVVQVLVEVPGLLRATAALLDHVDPAVAEVILRDIEANGTAQPSWFHSPAERARYVASSLRNKAEDVVGVVAKLRLARTP